MKTEKAQQRSERYARYREKAAQDREKTAQEQLRLQKEKLEKNKLREGQLRVDLAHHERVFRDTFYSCSTRNRLFSFFGYRYSRCDIELMKSTKALYLRTLRNLLDILTPVKRSALLTEISGKEIVTAHRYSGIFALGMPNSHREVLRLLQKVIGEADLNPVTTSNKISH